MDSSAHSQESSSEVQGSRYAGSISKTHLTGKSYAFLKPSNVKRKNLSSGSDSDSDSEREQIHKSFSSESEERPHVRGAAASQLDRRVRKNTPSSDGSGYGYGVPIQKRCREASTDSDVDDPKRLKAAPSSDSEADDRNTGLGVYNQRTQRFMSSDSEPERFASRNRLSVSSVDSATGDDDLSATDHGQSDLEAKQIEAKLAAGGWPDEPRSTRWSINDESTGDEESGLASENSRPSFFSERSSTSTSTSTSQGYKSTDDCVRFREERVFMDSRAQNMMEKMGYKSGQGLGKHGQGRVNPVEVSKQRGRRGLGHIIKGLEPASLTWDPNSEEILVQEKVLWISEANHVQLSYDILESWLTEGRKKLTIDDELEFCNELILKNVLSAKTVFDQLDGVELRKARARSNPFETIRNGIFLNRAAMKMANMDAICDFMFTRPKNEYGEHVVKDNELLYFADVCAGPGGFSEYVLYRKKWKAKGFGFTLKNQNDFKLSDFFAGPPESFQPFYGVRGHEGDGDVYNPENVQAFYDFVMAETRHEGVHFMMADGGFSVDGQENIQEILSKQLYLCQCLVALRVVRTGGHFVCKLFDLFTTFSVGLVYLMYKSFKEISLHKPNTSRPANSERYIICKWKRDDCEAIRDYMIHINDLLWKWGPRTEKDVVEIVPLNVIKDDQEFYSYICDSNNRIGRNQVIGLKKIAAFTRDDTLEELRQSDLKKASLEFWQVEDSARTAPPRKKPDDICIGILSNGERNNVTPRALEHELKTISPETFNAVLKCPFEWYFAVIGCPKNEKESSLTFFLSLGYKKVFARKNKKWVEERNVELAADTLILGEIVDELKGEHTSQFKTTTLHIVDAVRLGGVDVRNYVISERHKQCALFAEAMDKPSRNDLWRVQVKELFDLETAHQVITSRQKVIRTKKEGYKVAFVLKNEKFLLPGGIVFFKATQEPWGRTLSRRHNTRYYHAQGKEPIYENRIKEKHEAYKTTLKCHESAQIWWTYKEELHPDEFWAQALANYIRRP